MNGSSCGMGKTKIRLFTTIYGCNLKVKKTYDYVTQDVKTGLTGRFIGSSEYHCGDEMPGRDAVNGISSQPLIDGKNIVYL